MNSTNSLAPLIPMILPRIPFLIVCIIGIVVGLVQLGSHRKPAFLVLAGSGLLGFGFVISLGMNFLTIQRAQSGGSHAELAAILGVLGFVQGLFSAAGYGALIGAAFIDRNPPPVTRA